MERPNLLEDDAHLKFLLRQNERIKSWSLQDAKVRSSTSHVEETIKSNDDTNGLISFPLIHNFIYVNPNKIGCKSKAMCNNDSSTALKEQKALPIGSFNHSQVQRSKVFINPNFNKSVSHQKNVTNQSAPCSIMNVTNQHKISSHSGLKFNKPLRTSPELRQKTNPLNSTSNTKIFVNPNFNQPKNTLRCSAKNDNSCSFLDKKINGVSSTGTVLNSTKSSIYNELRNKNRTQPVETKNTSVNKINSSKRKNYHLNETFESSLDRYKRAKVQLKNGKESIGKIFINPSFKKELGTNKIQTDQKNINGLKTIAAACQPGTNASSGRIFNIGSLITLSPNCQMNKNDRKSRSSSSSLVSVSPTKLIRKRKLSQGSLKRKSIKKTPPIFLSKTKLVRNPTTYSIKEDVTLLNKTMIRRAVPKTQLHFLNAEQVKRLRRQNFTNSLTNLIDIMPSSNMVTKVKSKNGRSLKLIRNPLDSSVILRVRSGNGKSLKLIRNTEDLPTVAKMKSKDDKSFHLKRTNKESREAINEKRHVKSTGLRQNQFHMQQASKRAQYYLQSKWRRNQFSKINVPSTRKPIVHKNKYVFERNKTLSKNALSKQKVESRKILPDNFCHKFITPNAKSEISKYKVVRKATVDNTSIDLRKELKEFGSNSLPSTSSKKWKRRKKTLGTPQRKQLSIVNIGGVFYRCTRTSLCKNKPSAGKDQQTKGLLLKIRGQKFQFDDNGHTLKCLDNKPVRKRIDIGGVTFVSSSSGNSLTRTNYHTARSILTQAKQKSLTLLVNKRRKNNEPCPFYHRFGRCSGKERGTCIRQHDQKYVAVCKKFVSGACKDSKCLLSHLTSVHNMPTCQHFLAGQCGRDNCPYLHVKLSDSAPLCIDFLKGFCIRGDQCTKRHLELCPSFEKGVCPRGKYCPYPHPKSNNKFKRVVKTVRKKPSPPLEQKAVSINVRYFQDTNLQEENKIQLKEDLNDLHSVEETAGGEDIVHPLRNRPKLGRLPSYIPLSQDSSCSESEKIELCE